jgi:Phage tail tube protein, GTA-gp10
MSSVNNARGEAGLTINGKPYRLCLTLGALALIETALEVTSLKALSKRMHQLSAADVLVVLHALLVGGGNGLTDEELRGSHIEPSQAASAIAKAFSLAVQD